MATAHVVVTGSNSDTPNVGKIFDGISFFLVQRMPSRSRFVRDVETNGGNVVKIESQADYVIADHIRKDAPAGSYSYTLIETALRDGQIPDPPDHAIRPPDAVREVGSTAMGKLTRTPFTTEDDKFLWNWVEQAKAHGEALRGNEIYKRLEIVNPRHTHQSWRDRYVKYVSQRAPPGVTVSANPPPSPPVTAAENNVETPPQEPKSFTEQDFDKLLANAGDIEVITGAQWYEAWEAFANAEESAHTAEEWSSFYQLHVRPAYLKSVAEEQADHKRTFKSERDDPGTGRAGAVIGDRKRKQSVDEGHDASDRNKKQRTATPEINRIPDQAHALSDAQTEVDLQTSDQLQGLESQTDDDVEIPRGAVAGPVITSDLNAAANMQLEHEAEINDVTSLYSSQADERPSQNEHLPRIGADLPTSYANRAAGAQFGDWRASDNYDVDNGVNAVDNLEGPPSEEPVLQPASGPQLALTAENLASQQALHEPPLTRGLDLPKDAEDADQTHFLEYLHGIVGKNAGNETGRTTTLAHSARGQEVNADMVDGPDHTPSRHAKPDEILPLSSPQEIDDAFEAGLKWPVSPTQPSRQRAQRGQSSEPKSAYPQLPGQPQDSIARIDDGVGEPAETLMSQLERPTSSNRGGSGYQQDFEEIFSDDGDADDDEGQGQLHQSRHIGDEDENLDADERQGHSQPNRSIEDDDMVEDGNGVEDDEGIEDDEDIENDESIEDGEENSDYDDIDLGVVEPDGGFALSQDSEESQPHDGFDEQQNATSQPHHVVEISSQESSSVLSQSSGGSPQPSLVNGSRSHAVDTQDIINAETQKPDFEMPLPPSSDDDLDESFANTSRRMPANGKGKAKAIEVESLDTPEQVNAWVSTMVVRGYRKGAVVKALKCTSMRPDLALLVLIEQKTGKGFPTDVSGVWAQREDELLESGDAQGLEELDKKHGWEEMDSRMKFLEGWRALG